MKNTEIEAINKVTFSEENAFGSSLRILWVNAACSENKYTLNLKPHNHAFFEMHVIISGNLVYRFNDCEIKISGGQLVIIPPHVIHFMSAQSEDFQKMTVAFETDGELARILSDKRKRTIDLNEDSKASLDFIIRRAKIKTVSSEILIKNRLSELLYTVAETAAIRSTAVVFPFDTRIIKAKKYIEDNPQIFMTCDEVARYCNLSVKQLGRLFLQYENVSLLAFIHGQKIEDAKRMIKETDDLFETISEKLGFSSVNYFGKFFTKHTGVTPGDYRRGITASNDKS